MEQQQAGQQQAALLGPMAQLVRKTTGPAGLLGDQPPEVRAAAVRAVGRMRESWCAAMLLCEDDELRAVLLQEAGAAAAPGPAPATTPPEADYALKFAEILKQLQQLRGEQQQLLGEQQQLRGEQQQLRGEQQQQLEQLLIEQRQNYQGLVLDMFHPTSSISSSKELKMYRREALEFYYGSSSLSAYTCMVTGEECTIDMLAAGHIYRQQWPKSMLAKIGIKIHDPSNVILMQRQLEKAFDKWHWTVLPEGPDAFKVHVLYPPLLEDPLQQYISGHDGTGTRWQDIHSQLLKFPGLARPSRRLCGFHAALAIQNAEVQGWVAEGSVVVPGTSWDSPTLWYHTLCNN